MIGPGSTYHIWKDDPELTRGAVRQCFEVFGRRGLIITPCVSVHSIMLWQNALAMIDEWKKLRARMRGCRRVRGKTASLAVTCSEVQRLTVHPQIPVGVPSHARVTEEIRTRD